MSDAIGPPRRKRLSWECRCEIVAKVRLHGISPEVAAATSGVHLTTAGLPGGARVEDSTVGGSIRLRPTAPPTGVGRSDVRSGGVRTESAD